MRVSLPIATVSFHDRPDLLAYEHAVLTRQMGKTQARVSKLLEEQEARLQAMARDLIRLRGQLVCCHSAALWGIRPPTMPDTRQREQIDPAPASHTSADTEADQVICNTGCKGHAHHWLTADGRCQLTDLHCARAAPVAGRQANAVE